MGYIQEAREEEGRRRYAGKRLSHISLRSKMKQKAMKECSHYALKYAECASGRTISVVWKCHQQAKELNDCLHQFTNDNVLEEMKKDYVLQQDGRPSASV